MTQTLGTLIKAMRVLETLGEEGPLGLMELSRRLNMHKSVVSRILSTLRTRTFVRLHDGKFDVGLRIYELGQLVLDRLPFCKAIEPFVDRLAAATGETAYGAHWHDGQVSYLYDRSSAQAVRLGPRAGTRRAPWGDAVGMAVLAFHDFSKVLALLEASQVAGVPDLPSAEQLKRKFAQIRARGYAVEKVGVEGVVVASALRRDDMTTSAAFAVGGPAGRLHGARIDQVAQSIIRVGMEASQELGWTKRQQQLTV